MGGKVRKCLKSTKAYNLCQETDETNLNCLTLAVSFMAPLDIIEDVHRIDPTLVLKRDHYGAMALHTGCLNGASFEAIEFLLKIHQEAVKKLDLDQRSPLHHAVECACCTIVDGNDNNNKNSNSSVEKEKKKKRKLDAGKSSFRMTRNSTSNDYSEEDDSILINSRHRQDLLEEVQVVAFLCDMAPEMVHTRDNAGVTPTDLVQNVKFNTDPSSDNYFRLQRVYKVLRKTSIRIYKKNKELWEKEASLLKEYVKFKERFEQEQRRDFGEEEGDQISRGETTSGTSSNLCNTSSLSSVQNPHSTTEEYDSCMRMRLSGMDEEGNDTNDGNQSGTAGKDDEEEEKMSKKNRLNENEKMNRTEEKEEDRNIGHHHKNLSSMGAWITTAPYMNKNTLEVESSRAVMMDVCSC